MAVLTPKCSTVSFVRVSPSETTAAEASKSLTPGNSTLRFVEVSPSETTAAVASKLLTPGNSTLRFVEVLSSETDCATAVVVCVAKVSLSSTMLTTASIVEVLSKCRAMVRRIRMVKFSRDEDDALCFSSW